MPSDKPNVVIAILHPACLIRQALHIIRCPANEIYFPGLVFDTYRVGPFISSTTFVGRSPWRHATVFRTRRRDSWSRGNPWRCDGPRGAWPADRWSDPGYQGKSEAWTAFRCSWILKAGAGHRFAPVSKQVNVGQCHQFQSRIVDLGRSWPLRTEPRFASGYERP